MQRFFSKLLPFIFAGIALVAFAFGIMLLAYLFLFGALVGLVLFTIAWVKAKFFPAKQPVVKKTGRIIDTHEWKKRF